MSTQVSNAFVRALRSAGEGDAQAAVRLLPLIYNELRTLARVRMAKTPPATTLQATALVHEAYLRLVGKGDPGWRSRGHFFGAAALAMREILVERARRRSSRKHGGGRRRIELSQVEPCDQPRSVDLLALDEALQQLEQADGRQARIVMLRYFAGLTVEETAAALDISPRTVKREWRFSKRYLFALLSDSHPGAKGDGHDGRQEDEESPGDLPARGRSSAPRA
jgi:RNA polymerase sigma factor (TIGR02999 family)